MNDADNNNTDNEAGLRTSDIYERFLNRVQNIDSEDNLDASSLESLNSVKRPSMYEPLNEEELRLFTEDYEQEIDSQELGPNSVDISFSDDDKVTNGEDEAADLSELSIDDVPTHNNDNLATELEINSSNKKTGALWGKQVSSSKLLTIGVVCGLLLSALIVLALNAMGVLAALSDSLAPNSAQIMPASSNDSAVTSEQPVNENVTNKTGNLNDADKIVAGTAISTKTASNDTLSADATVSDNTLERDNTKTVLSKEVPAQLTSKQNEVKNNSTDNITKNSTVADIDISPEDFREEAQNTLYRESKD